MFANCLPALTLLALTFVISWPISAESPTEGNGHPKHHARGGFRNYPVVQNPENLTLEFYWKRFVSSFVHPNVPADHVLSEDTAVAVYESLRDENTITWIGQSTLLIKVNGVVMLTDPFFSKRASPVIFGPSRYADPGIGAERLPDIDILLISHNHYDHLDAAFVEAIPNKASVHVLVPLELRGFFLERGYENVHELDWYQSVSIAGLELTALPSVHYSGRGVNDKNETLWCSWAISSPVGRYFFVGDSAYSPTLFKEIARKFGDFDLAMLGIGTYGNRKYGVNNHMAPEEAVMIGQELNAGTLLGIHWGTIDLSEEDAWEPPKRFRSAAEKAGYAAGAAWVMKIGETRKLPE